MCAELLQAPKTLVFFMKIQIGSTLIGKVFFGIKIVVTDHFMLYLVQSQIITGK